LTLGSRDRVRTLFLWLSLAIVLTCAIGSFGSPVRASSGSAFNAFTSDVAIGPSRAGAPEKARRELTAPSGGDGQAKAILAALPAFALPARAPVRDNPAPSLKRPDIVTAGAVGARAPPLR
jgi:hypothetical protein